MDKTLNKESLENYFKLHYEFLCLFSFQIIKDQDAAQDIVQDFFMDLWRRKDEIDIRATFRNYAMSAIRYRSIMWLKQLQKEQQLKAAKQTEELNTNPQYTATYEDIAEENQIYEQSYEQAQFILEQLPVQRRNIFLAYVNGLSYKQIAERYNISINTVKTQMKRTYALLKNKGSIH